jgi:hypothetical protein
VQLAEQLFDRPVEKGFLRLLEEARSNDPQAGTGRDLYARHVKPSIVDLRRVAAHYAVVSLFQELPSPAPVYCYSVERENGRSFRAGRSRLSIGGIRASSLMTGKTGRFVYAVLHFGDHNLNAGVAPGGDPEAYRLLVGEAGGAFESGDLPQVIRLLDRFFGDVPYSLKSLFRDEQRRVLDRILASTLDEVEDEYRDVYRHHAPLMRFLKSLGTPPPAAFAAAAEYVLNVDLKRGLAGPDLEEVQRLLEEKEALGVALDAEGLSYTLQHALERLAERLLQSPEDLELLRRIEGTVALTRQPPFDVDLWRVQNRCYELRRSVYPRQREKAEEDGSAAEWVRLFEALAERLAVRVD